ncbi:MAG: hypothetical protein RML40_09465 [Bacteroidota bacterium]|nr:hypothetical protein [Candidatus Kapabacteria bacterium]MDW8220746.1 hypothetical protein [Bacteroidota bacterium]
MSFHRKYPLDDRTYVEVIREHEHNNNKWSPQIILHLYISDSPGADEASYTQVARMMLRSLEPIVEHFSPDDFVQHGLKSVLPGKGYAHRLHDFLITHHNSFPFPIANVYSTDPSIDNIYFIQRNQPRLYISESAVRFWKKRIEQGKAEYIPELKRYRIKW